MEFTLSVPPYCPSQTSLCSIHSQPRVPASSKLHLLDLTPIHQLGPNHLSAPPSGTANMSLYTNHSGTDFLIGF